MADESKDTFAPATTGGAARAVAAAAERMRSNPPSFAAAPPDAAPPEGSTPEVGDESTSSGEEVVDKAQTPGDEPRHRLVSAVKLEEEKQASEAPPASEDDGEAEASAYAKLLARYENDPEKLAKVFYETEQRAASMAKQLKGKPGAPGPELPAPESTPAEAPAPPPTDNEVEQAVAADANQWLQADPQMKQWNDAFIVNRGRLGEILTDTGGVMKGELVEIGRSITKLEGLLDPNGVEGIVQIDEDQREVVERRLEQARTKRERLKVEYDNLLDANGRLQRAWDTRWSQATDHFRGQRRSTVDQARAADALRSDEAAAESEWNTELARVTHKLSPEDRAEAARRLRTALAAEAKGETEFEEDFGPWIDQQMKVIRADWDRRSGATARATAQRREAINRQPAPVGQAAQAERQELPQTVDKRAARRAAEMRAGALARDVRVIPIRPS